MARLRGRPIYHSKYPIHPCDITAMLEPIKRRMGHGDYPLEVRERMRKGDHTMLDEYDASVGRRWRPESMSFVKV